MFENSRILYLRTVYWFDLKCGGSVGHTAGVINALDKKIELDVVSNDVLSEVKREIEIIKPIKLKLGIDKLFNLSEILYSIKIIKFFKKPALKKYKAIYQRYSGYSFAGAYLAKKYHIPLILEFNSSDVWKIKNWTTKTNIWRSLLRNLIRKFIRLPIVKCIESYNIRNANLIVVVSQVLKGFLVDYGVKPTKILVNPNGINPEIYTPEINGGKIRKKYFLEDKIIIGFIGTFGQWHGVCEMARAIIRFYEKNLEKADNTKFLLIGDGILFNEVQNLINNSPYKDSVIFTRGVPQEEAPKYLAACDIFLSPHIKNPDGSKFFGSPTKLFEYMGMGKAIIASDLDQIGEILEHKKTAYLVEPGNIEQLADAINILCEDVKLRDSLGENAREEVVAKHTWDKHAENILEKIKGLEK
ncbi:glycosyltransferase family 4 protein [bacterium]|jgi:glycosyltransferase involved in cell wall biosynthesis|nr:glycosyltransferase family 4 protein [bacterium]MBT3581963.1 glycosyltransferase family 4 protein [bacterium]MBT4551684.1 glycosyltransferase family 4 protein [bacterium]MBT7087606.1 glycosyltransferase family 4 protein [bacterium]